MNKINLVDQVIIDHPMKSDIKSDALELIRKKSNVKLKVEIDATHSGLLTNLRVYPGKYVKASYLSYLGKDKGGTSDYSAPILKHHNDEASDPIGRVVAAQFIQLKQGEMFERDYLSPDNEYNSGKGSGVVRIAAEIYDADAIEKIIDSRLLSVSSGHAIDQLLCSICGNPLLAREADTCEHIPGKHYEVEDESYLCYGITGKLKYKEVSFVNIPAQPPSKVVNWEEVKFSDSQDIIIPFMTRGKKASISSMRLLDSTTELDLLLGRSRSSTKTTSILVPRRAQKDICSSLDGQLSSTNSTASVEPVDSMKEGNDLSIKPDNTNDQSVSVKSKESTQNDVIKDRPSSSDDQTNDEKSNVSALDNNSSKEKTMDLEKEITALKASLEDMTKKNKDLDEQVRNLKALVETKDSEVKQLNENLKSTKESTARDYAGIVAHYRILLDKSDTKGLDSEEKRKVYVDTLAKRSTESLKDALTDLLIDISDSKTTKKVEKIDLSKDRLDTPVVSTPPVSKSKLSATDVTNKIFDGE